MSRPNLLLFMPDQLRADAVGAFGNPAAHTPNIDALAGDGTRFDNAYAQHSVCAQSRISMFTGWYPHVNGHRTLDHLIQPHEPHVFARLKESGYHVALAGARGDMLGAGLTKASSHRFGFTTPPKLADVATWHSPPFEEGSKWYDAFYCGPVDRDLYELDAATVTTAIDWLTDGMPEPWCLFVPLIFPHPPFVAERRWYDLHDPADMPKRAPTHHDGKPGFYGEIHERYGLGRLDDDDWAEISRTYYAMVSRVDDQLGRVRAAVDETGAADRTVSFFFTDHGEYLGDFGLVEKWPAGVDDVLLRNPLIVHDPTDGTSGSRSGGAASTFVELVDLAATIEDYAELEPSYTHFGQSLRPLVDDPTTALRDAAFSEGGFLLSEEPILERGTGGIYKHKQAIQHDRTDLVGKVLAVRTEAWTYVERLYEGAELYDRGADLYETINVVDDPANADVVAHHRDRLFRWLWETSDVIPWQADERMDDDLKATFIPK